MSEPHRDHRALLHAVSATEPCTGRVCLAWTLLVLVLSATVGALELATSNPTLRYPDAFDYAQLGRQLWSGQGFTTLETYPYVLSRLAELGVDTGAPWPTSSRFPLPIVTAAASYALLGPNDLAALVPAWCASVLTAPLLFLLGNRLGGPLAGLLSAGLWLASPSRAELSLTGLTEPGATFLAVTVVLMALRAREQPSWERFAWLGAALGLAWLQRSTLLALAPGAVALALWSAPRRLERAGALLAGALAFAAPWLIRNWLVFGDPTLDLTRERGLLRLGLGADPFFSLAPPDPGAVLNASLTAYPGGWSFAWLWEVAPEMLGREFAWLLPAAALAWVYDARRLRGGVLAAAAAGWTASVLALAPAYPDVYRFYWPFAALLLVGTCASAVSVLTRLQPAPRVAIAFAALLLFAVFAPRQAAAPLLPVRDPADLRWLAEAVPADTIVTTDQPHYVSWQAGRAAVYFPGDFRTAGRIDAQLVRIGAVHFSPRNQKTATLLDHPPLSGVFRPVPAPRGVLYLQR